MSVEVWGMTGAGLAALIAGFVLVWPRLQAASGTGKILVLGPVFEAVALAIFAAEHFTAARDLTSAVPRWLPWHLFWVYFFGAALLAAAISFITWRCVRWSAALLASFFLIIVITLDLPNLPAGMHDRFFWILTVRETVFAAGVIVLAGSVWPRGDRIDFLLERIGRFVLAGAMIFYAVQHFLFPQHVPGVPLEKLTPAWVPAPTLLAYFIGAVLLIAGMGLLIPRGTRIAAAGAGIVLVILTVLFYVPIFLLEMHTPLAVEGMNYIGDTLLFAATILLAGLSRDSVNSKKAIEPAAAPPALAGT